MNLIKFSLLIFVVCNFTTYSFAQDPLRFEDEIQEITKKGYDTPASGTERVVFTGSSSVRMWKDVQDYFPQVQAINTGFGGSHYSDLLYYQKELIFDFNPDKVFIYEGDNDISDKEEPEAILAEAKTLVENIKKNLPDTEIFIISPKPSISRWALQQEYEELNALLEAYSNQTEGVTFIDVWNPMLNEEGTPINTIFLEDDLHMNESGYKIWGDVIGKFVD